MEGHKVDDDADLSNDEELPLDLSTKEPKTSSTTAQVEELGQALGISQLHRSLEKISKFIERNFNEDSDVLEQSSDKETTSHSKRKASDSTSKRPSKRRKSEQCSSAKKKTEQSGSSFDPSVNDLLESSEDEDQTDESTEDLGISTSIFNDEECLGPKVSDALAKIINEAFSKKPIESKFKALAEKHCSPENVNCNLLTVPRVNEGIWNYLPRASTKLDVGLQEAKKSAVHAAQAITLAVESLIQCKEEKTELDQKVLLDYLCDSLSFIGNASFQVSLKRRELLKPDLSKDFRSLCSPSTPLSCFLFGDELSKSVEDIPKANKIMAKVMPKKGKTSPDNRQDKRPFLRGRSTASRRGRYNYSYNKRVLPREAKSLRQGQEEQSVNVSYVGNLANFVENWRQITSVPWILQS